MPTRTERITNADGTVTVRKTSGIRIKHEADWGDGPHPDKKPHTGNSALDRKWEKAEEKRKQRLLGRDGGPKEGDIRNANDEALAKATERRRRMRVLRGDPEGSSSQEGTRRANWLLTESENKEELQAWVDGATGDRPDLWGEDYRSEDGQRINYERSAEAGGEDWEKWSGDFKGFTGSDPTGTWADDRQTITAAEEGYEKDEERYRTDFRELTGQDSTGEPDQDQMLINFYTRRNLGLPKSSEPITAEQREAALAEIAKKQERYRTEFRAFTGQDSTGDPDKDQLIINFYERRNLRLPKSTEPITEAEREELQAKRDQKRTEYQRQFLVYTGQPSTGDPERDAEIINVEQRKTAGQLPALEYRDEERDRQAAHILQLEANNRVFSDAVAAPPDPGLDRAKFSGLVDQTGRPILSHLMEARAGDATPALPDPSQPVTPGIIDAEQRTIIEDWAKSSGLRLTDADFQDPVALQQKIEKFVGGKQLYADQVQAAQRRYVSSIERRNELLEFRDVLGNVDVSRLTDRQVEAFLHIAPEIKARQIRGDAKLASMTPEDLETFAQEYPQVSVDGHLVQTRDLINQNAKTPPVMLAKTLQDLARDGRISVGKNTEKIPSGPRQETSVVKAYDSTGRLRILGPTDYRTGNIFTTEDGFTGTAGAIRARANQHLTTRDKLLYLGGASSLLNLPLKDIASRMESSPGARLYVEGEKVSGGDLVWAGAEVLPVGTAFRLGRSGVTTVARTFGPRQITIPFTNKAIQGPGGFVSQATPDVPVPRLLLSKDDPAAAAISGEVFKEIGATGRVEGLYGHTEFSYTPTPFGEVMHTANPDSVLHLSSTGHSDLVALGPPAKAKPDKGPAEQYFFVQEGDVTSRLMPGSAFDRTGGKSPGIHVYSDLDAAAVGSEFVRVVEADGTIKQWPRRGNFEVERGIQSGDNIPPSYRESTVGIPGGQLYLAEYVALPSYRQRVAANLKAIFDFKNSQRGKFQYRTASDLEDLSPAGRQRLEERFQAARQAKEAEFQQGLSDETFTAADHDAFFRSVDDETKAAISREQVAFDAAAPDRAALESRARRAVEDLRRMARSGETPAARAAAIAALGALERDGILTSDRSENQGERGQSEARTDGPEVVTSQPPRASQPGTEGADRLTEPPLREVTSAPVFVPEDIGTPPVVPRVPGAPPSLSTGGVRVPPPIPRDITVPSLPAGRDVRVPLPVDRGIGITTPGDRDVGITTPRDRDIRIPQQRDLDDDSPSRRPDLGAPPVGEEGYTEEDEYPRVVAHTKVVQVQTALNDGDTVETPLEVKNFRVVATGRRPHPGKLLEGRHVEIETDSTGDPKPLMKPPTRHRRRSLNKPPLGPQSRRQTRSSATRQSGVPMLRRIGPRIGRRR